MPLHVRFAHMAATDTPTVLWLSLALLFAVRIVQDGKLADCLWAGFFVGLAGATKYPGALIAIPVGLAALLRWPTWRTRVWLWPPAPPLSLLPVPHLTPSSTRVPCGRV